MTRGSPEMLPDGAPPLSRANAGRRTVHTALSACGGRLDAVKGRAALPGISAARAITPRIRVPGRAH